MTEQEKLDQQSEDPEAYVARVQEARKKEDERQLAEGEPASRAARVAVG
jgi:hypothetical protein